VDLINVIRIVASGDAAVAPGVVVDDRVEGLTSRERDVLVELTHGRSKSRDREVYFRLGGDGESACRPHSACDIAPR
jgi:hypothetical protein